jgi:hypothetical protein
MGSYPSSFVLPSLNEEHRGGSNQEEGKDTPFTTPRADSLELFCEDSSITNRGLKIKYYICTPSDRPYLIINIQVPCDSSASLHSRSESSVEKKSIKIPVPKYHTPRMGTSQKDCIIRNPELYLSEVQSNPVKYVKQYYRGSILLIESISLHDLDEEERCQTLFLPSEHPLQLADQLHSDMSLLESYLGYPFKKSGEGEDEHRKHCRLLSMEVI